MGFRTSVVDKAAAAAFDALPQRLSVREMPAAAGVSLWSLQRERYLAERLGVGLRTLRRACPDKRADTAYVAVRLQECCA